MKHIFRTRNLITTAVVIGLMTTGSTASAQRKDAEDLTMTTRAGVRLAATYWQSEIGKESPAIVLLHGEQGNRKKWKRVGRSLQQTGYAVLAVDLRKHGDSAGATEAAAEAKKSKRGKGGLKPDDYLAMISDDMEAVKVFLMQKHHAGELNVRKTGFVAVGDMGAVAMNAAALDWARKPYPDGPPSARTPRGQDVQTLVLISPGSVKGVKTVNAVKQLKAAGVSYLVVVGSKDSSKRKAADKLVKTLRGRIKKDMQEEKVILKQYPIKLNGDDLVAKDNAEFATLFKQFHDKKLKAIPQPWRDRHNKLDK